MNLLLFRSQYMTVLDAASVCSDHDPVSGSSSDSDC